jgi:hypothetical protein
LVSALDVLIVVNEINLTGPRGLPLGVLGGPFLDVNRDWQLTADDVLKVINRLNLDPQAVAGGEGEAGTASAAPESLPPAETASRVSAPGVWFQDANRSPPLAAQRVDQVFTPARTAAECVPAQGRRAGAPADSIWDDAAGFEWEDLLVDLAFAEA